VPMIFTGQETLQERMVDLGRDISRSIERLTSLKERLELFDEESEETPPAALGRERPDGGTTIFVVHGRSEAPKLEVARFLDQVTTLQPIILHEQPNSGRTIIEKFEDHAAAAAFAVVLLTGDDEGGLAGSGVSQRRARQNVVFDSGSLLEFLGGLE
jgi:predicted nucleotide-binding protein